MDGHAESFELLVTMVSFGKACRLDCASAL